MTEPYDVEFDRHLMSVIRSFEDQIAERSVSRADVERSVKYDGNGFKRTFRSRSQTDYFDSIYYAQLNDPSMTRENPYGLNPDLALSILATASINGYVWEAAHNAVARVFHRGKGPDRPTILDLKESWTRYDLRCFDPCGVDSDELGKRVLRKLLGVFGHEC